MVIVVTGASSGIGYDIAKMYSDMGHKVIGVARREDKLKLLKQNMNSNCKVISMDLSQTDNCYKLYEILKEEKVDILINNAGFGILGEFRNIDLEQELKMIDTNIIALHILTKLFLKDMIKNNKGYILNVASIAGILPCGPYMATYYATKSYVYSMTRSIQRELKEKKLNVKIGVLCPGPVNTEFNDVSGAKFSIKAMSSKRVAKIAIKQIEKKKLKVIPGLFNKILIIITKLFPENIVIYFNSKMQNSKYK